ncbi:hypothetical protein MRX96_052809 [Rhipicephalus microplus]
MPLGKKCGSSVSEGLTWTLYRRGFVSTVEVVLLGLEQSPSVMIAFKCIQVKLDESKLKPWQLTLKQSFDARRAAAIKKRGGEAKDPASKKAKVGGKISAKT